MLEVAELLEYLCDILGERHMARGQLDIYRVGLDTRILNRITNSLVDYPTLIHPSVWIGKSSWKSAKDVSSAQV